MMKAKPQLKSEVAIVAYNPNYSRIIFFATQDAKSDFECFGEITEVGKNQYWLIVDTRYNFNEVIDYIATYDEP